MASHDQSYRAGEAHGRLEERKNQMMKDKAEGKTYETAQFAKDETREDAGCRAKETTDRSGSYISEKAGAAKQKVYDTAKVAREKAPEMAQGAKEAVKHTFGMANEDDDNPIYNKGETW